MVISFQQMHSPARAPYGHSRHNLLLAAIVLELLDEGDEDIFLCGWLIGTKNIKHTSKSAEEMFDQLGSYSKQAWKSDLDHFLEMHNILQTYLEEEFGTGDRSRGVTINGEVSTKLHLSAAIRYYMELLFMISCSPMDWVDRWKIPHSMEFPTR